MDTRKVASEYRLAHWSQRLQAKAHSGQSIKDFCATEGVSRNTYFYWQRKLREAACTELASRERELGTSLVPNGWSRLEAAEPNLVGAEMTIEVNGCRISVSLGTDPNLLATVCRTLKSL